MPRIPRTTVPRHDSPPARDESRARSAPCRDSPPIRGESPCPNLSPPPAANHAQISQPPPSSRKSVATTTRYARSQQPPPPSPCVSAIPRLRDLRRSQEPPLSKTMLPRRYSRLLARPGSAESRVLNPLLRQARSPTIHLLRRHLTSALVTLVFAEVSSPSIIFPLPHQRSLSPTQLLSLTPLINETVFYTKV
jgi:hypothetical protein